MNRLPTHELGSLIIRCWDCNKRPVKKLFDICPVCLGRYEFTGFQKDYPISEASLKEIA